MKIRTLIIDDVWLARRRIERVLSEDSEIEIVGECSDGIEAIEAIERLDPDLVFLDIQMPEMGGFEVIENICLEKAPLIIFVTAFDEFAIRAFQVHAFDYLLKPFEIERLQTTIERAKSQIQKRGEINFEERLKELIESVKKQEKYLKRLTVKSRGKAVFLTVDEIDYIVSSGNYLNLYVGSQTYMIRASLQYFETRLDPEKFVRIHRSTIVNLDSVKEMHPLFNGDQVITMKNDKQLNLSRKYRDRFNKRMESF